jgi:hypothetical protein
VNGGCGILPCASSKFSSKTKTSNCRIACLSAFRIQRGGRACVRSLSFLQGTRRRSRRRTC